MADYDVVVVGSGVAGAICAAGLAAVGKKVLILEAAENALGVSQREQFKRAWDTVPRKTWNTPYLNMPGIKNYPSPVTDDVAGTMIRRLIPTGRVSPPSRERISASPADRLGRGAATRPA